jgi:phosphoglycerate dehydrogenase-like enzyme
MVTELLSFDQGLAPQQDRCTVWLPPKAPDWLVDAIASGGAVPGDPGKAAAAVWPAVDDAPGLAALLGQAPRLRWVQFAHSGVEIYADAGLLRTDLSWTSAKGLYAAPVAEHALALALAGLRGIKQRATARTWTQRSGASLVGESVTILGRGGVAREIARLVTPLGCRVRVVASDRTPLPWAHEVIPWAERAMAFAGSKVVFIALALTPTTTAGVGAVELAAMDEDAWIVNVSRGAHLVTADLVEALQEERIGGAALDVTEPEPLPDRHPLWELDRCLITPHTAVTDDMGYPLLAQRIAENVRRFRAGQKLLGLVQPEHGY